MTTFVKNTCAHCQKEFDRTLSKHNQSVKRGSKPYCSQDCAVKSKIKAKIFQCAECGEEVLRTISNVSKVKNVFCNHSCAAKFNNRTVKKRFLSNSCCVCGCSISSGWVYCKECKPAVSSISKTSLRDLSSLSCYVKQAKIRDNSRRLYLKSDKPKECVKCGYNKHFHVCHIKAIKDFDLDTLVSEVNNLDNLTALCPNHHWELDNGYLTLS